MKPVHLLDVISQKNNWLTERQSVVARNVANVSTPGYKSLDLKPFEESLAQADRGLLVTNASHMTVDASSVPATEVDAVAEGITRHSGNNVSLEREFLKSGQVRREYALNVGVAKAFNRMLIMSAKG